MASQKTKKAKPAGSRKKPDVTTVLHAESKDGAGHVVGIGNLHVMLFNDDGSWFAQALEIDYFAEGSSLEDVQERFQNGLRSTVDYHLRLYGDITEMLQPAPAEAWKEFLSGTTKLRQRYSQVSIHTTGDELAMLPFTAVEYYEKAA